jgi:hypothetical protein
VLHKIIVYAMEYEEAERRTNCVETSVSIMIFFLFFFFSLSLSLSFARRRINLILITRARARARVSSGALDVPRKIRPQFGVFQLHFFLNTKYDKAADIRLASTL